MDRKRNTGRRPPSPATAATEAPLLSRPALVTYRLLRLRGFSAVEAGNLAAFLAGLHPVERGWTPSEIDHLLFVRALGPLVGSR